MPTIWGSLARIDDDRQGSPWVQVNAIVSGRTTICVRASIGKQTVIVRGLERIDVSGLCAGKFVEVSYRHGRDGFIEAETIYVQPEHAATE